MNSELWKDTPFETFAAEIDSTPLHRLAYFIGATEQRVKNLFDGETNPEARNVARILLHQAAGKVSMIDAEASISQIVAAWRKRRGLN